MCALLPFLFGLRAARTQEAEVFWEGDDHKDKYIGLSIARSGGSHVWKCSREIGFCWCLGFLPLCLEAACFYTKALPLQTVVWHSQKTREHHARGGTAPIKTSRGLCQCCNLEKKADLQQKSRCNEACAWAAGFSAQPLHAFLFICCPLLWSEWPKASYFL